MRMKTSGPLIAGILLAAAGTAGAADKTTTFDVKATVAANCFVSADDLDFGAYDGTAAKSGKSTIDVRCSKNHPYELKLSTGGSGDYTQRLMDGVLEYNLFTDATLGTIWGDGTSSTGTVDGNGQGLSPTSAATHDVIGELPNSAVNQDVPVGSYSDTITVTIEY
jgi:spore coat protein U-like protein